METYAIVRPEHLNHHGYLFGGVMLKWIDEFAWLAATLDYPDSTFVTVAMDDIEFKKRVTNGSILRFDIKYIKKGNSSVTYQVNVFAKETKISPENFLAFSTKITFVNIDKYGKPQSI
jgi:acyl-CoA hydrolase